VAVLFVDTGLLRLGALDPLTGIAVDVADADRPGKEVLERREDRVGLLGGFFPRLEGLDDDGSGYVFRVVTEHRPFFVNMAARFARHRSVGLPLRAPEIEIDQAFELGPWRLPLVSDDHRLAGETGIGGREFIRAIEIRQPDAGLATIAAEVPDFAAMPGDLTLNEGQVGARHYTKGHSG
jgi:hypothetical protein